MQTAALETLVGERTVPLLRHENYWFRRHEVAYVWLAPLLASAAAENGVVLEAGAGEGSGVDLIRAAGVTKVAALDYDAATVAHGAAQHGGGAACGLPPPSSDYGDPDIVGGSTAAVHDLVVIARAAT